MLAIAHLSPHPSSGRDSQQPDGQQEEGSLAAFEFGALLDPARDAEALLRWVVEDYDARRDEQWRVVPPIGEPILAKLLVEAKTDEERSPLIRALGFYAMPDVGPTLVGPYAGADKPRELRLAAIRALGSMAFHDSAAALWPALDDANEDVAAEAITALGKMGVSDVLPHLERAGQRSPRLSAVAVAARRRTEAALSRDRERLVDEIIASRDYEDLGVLMPFVWQHVAIVMVNPERGEAARIRAVRLLGLTRTRNAGSAAVTVLNDPSLPLRVEVVRALGRMRYRQATPTLVRMLSPDDQGRATLGGTSPQTPQSLPPDALHEALIVALGEIGDRRSFEPLLHRYYDRGGAVRGIVLLAARRHARVMAKETYASWAEGKIDLYGRALYFFGDDLSTTYGLRRDLLDAALKHEAPEVRREAALLYGLFGVHEDADSLIATAQTDKDPLNRVVAARAYDRLKALDPKAS